MGDLTVSGSESTINGLPIRYSPTLKWVSMSSGTITLPNPGRHANGHAIGPDPVLRFGRVWQSMAGFSGVCHLFHQTDLRFLANSCRSSLNLSNSQVVASSASPSRFSVGDSRRQASFLQLSLPNLHLFDLTLPWDGLPARRLGFTLRHCHLQGFSALFDRSLKRSAWAVMPYPTCAKLDGQSGIFAF